jgi:hypothetical protein
MHEVSVETGAHPTILAAYGTKAMHRKTTKRKNLLRLIIVPFLATLAVASCKDDSTGGSASPWLTAIKEEPAGETARQVARGF